MYFRLFLLSLCMHDWQYMGEPIPPPAPPPFRQNVTSHHKSLPHCKPLCSALLPPVTAVDACEGMTGSLVVKGVKSHQYKSFKVDGSDWPPKYWKVVLELDGDVSLAFSDARRFARVRLQVSLNLFLCACTIW